MEIPAYAERIDGMIFTLTFSEQSEELRCQLCKVSKAFAEIASSTKLRQIFETILAVGNYLNGTTARGGAWGFTLTTLDKIYDLKSQDTKTTLLDYAVSLCDKSKPELLTVG